MEGAGKLAWQCRRGSKELDVLLQNYLQRHYRQADETEKKLFSELLQLEDGELSALLLNVADPRSRYGGLVRKINTE